MTDGIVFSIGLVAASGLLLTLSFEVLQVFPKLAGAVLVRNSRGANSALKLLLFNRLGAALFFPAFGFLVDSGREFADLAYLVANGLLAFCVLVCIFTLFFRRFLALAIKVFFSKKLSIESLFPSQFENGPVLVSYAVTVSAIAGLFGAIGLTFPMLLGTVFYEHRLTLANFGFIFNSIFSILTVFVIDHRLSELCDTGSDSLVSFARSILVGRVIGVLVVAVIYFISGVYFAD